MIIYMVMLYSFTVGSRNFSIGGTAHALGPVAVTPEERRRCCSIHFSVIFLSAARTMG